ncbi:MAG: site-specific DNA-methyltransferase [Chloroflexi bacterium]|nr:site-specific DNA-methyltransferase [Chloroflexota bacterium]
MVETIRTDNSLKSNGTGTIVNTGPSVDTILVGDARQVLQRLPADFFQACITSPPYWGLRDYSQPGQLGAESDLNEYVFSLVQIFGEVRRVLRDDGCCWLNIGDGYTSGDRGWRAPDRKNPARAMGYRPPTPLGLKPKDLLGGPWRVAFALQDAGWFQAESLNERTEDGLGSRNRRSVWSIPTEPATLGHPAPFPPALVEPCVLGTTRPGDWVLDPFFGVGTVGLVASQYRRHYVGIELKEAYAALAKHRLAELQGRQ